MSVPDTKFEKMMASYHEWRAERGHPVAFYPAYVDVISYLSPTAKDDVPAALLLSQILYWCLPSKDGKPKLRVKKEGLYWIAKSREEWYQETRLTKDRTDRALTVLEKAGLIERRNFMFAGKRTAHVRFIPIAFVTAWYNVIHNIAPEAVVTSEVVNVAPAHTGRSESLRPIAAYPNDRSEAFTATGHRDIPLPITETTSQNTSQNTSKQYSSTPLPPTHGGTPLSRCAPTQKTLEWAAVPTKEQSLWKAQATAELLESGVEAERLRDTMIEQRARNLYEKQAPGGFMDLKQEKK